jgi:hypothetical protein
MIVSPPASPQATMDRRSRRHSEPRHLLWPVSGLTSKTGPPSRATNRHSGIRGGLAGREAPLPAHDPSSTLAYRCGGSTPGVSIIVLIIDLIVDPIRVVFPDRLNKLRCLRGKRKRAPKAPTL